MNQKFPKTSRILERAEYLDLFQKAQKKFGKYLVVDYTRSTSPCSKLGLTVTKKFGKAHERNRFKRIIREAFRKNNHLFSECLNINIRPRTLAKEAPTVLILEELLNLLKETQCKASL